jgi:hypothetical protein
MALEKSQSRDGREQCSNIEEGGRPPSEAVTGKLAETGTETVRLCVIVICKIYSTISDKGVQ